jgi:hypothetical protein
MIVAAAKSASRLVVSREKRLMFSMASATPHPSIDLGQRLLSGEPRLSMLLQEILKTWEERMIRLIAFGAFALAVTTSAQAFASHTGSCAGPHDHGNRLRMRAVQDTS